ncbi:MAG: RNA-binding domain-containing protein [Nocardioides sp.]
MIQFDTSRLPTGSLGWTRLFEAIENAQPEDETYWVEFKSGHDPVSTEGKAAIAKAIVAFANRDPAVAKRWLEGHALVVLGVEPGRVPGAEIRDPATIHQTIQPFLAAPAPRWDLSYHTYKGNQILTIIVEPPQAGDSIAVIGKSSGKIEDGNIYVRRPGISDRAKSADIRQLSERLVQRQAPGLDIEVTAAADDDIEGVPIYESPASWIDEWVAAEGRRLLKPLEEFEQPAQPITDERFAGLRLAGRGRINEPKLASVFGATTTPEARTPQEYRHEVSAYLSTCRTKLEGADFDAALEVLPQMVWRLTNLGNHNLTKVKVKIHVGGDVAAYEARQMDSLRSRVGRPPRLWGPQTTTRIPSAAILAAAQRASIPAPLGLSGLSPSRPEIKNGDSFEIGFPPVTLRPAETCKLGTAVVVPGPGTDPMVCNWTATATNLSGLAEGSFEMSIRNERVSLYSALRYQEPQSRAIRPNPGSGHE